MPIRGEVSPLDVAIQIAAKYHAGQKDKAGQPYILHPMRVMARLEGEDELVAAALHDVLEDTPCTVSELREAGIPDPAITAVIALTHDKASESTTAYLNRVAANPIAKRVKLSDLEDNMNLRRLKEFAEKDAIRVQKYLHTWRFLTHGTPMPEAYEGL